MKFAKSLIVLAAMASASNAAVTIGGTIVAGAARESTATTGIAAGRLGMLVIDVDGDGFLGLDSTLVNNTVLTASSDPGLGTTAAGLTAGSTFGGDYVFATFGATGTGSFGSIVTSLSIAGYEGKQFAIVYFDSINNGATGTAAAGSHYGIVRGDDWTLPATDSGNFTSSATDANGATSFYQIAAAPTAAQSFFRTTAGDGTRLAASFTIVPEPSSALLGAIGALALLRRRR